MAQPGSLPGEAGLAALPPLAHGSTSQSYKTERRTSTVALHLPPRITDTSPFRVATMSEEHGHDVTFESADAGSSTTYPIQAGTIRKGGMIAIKGRPCKVGAAPTHAPSAARIP